MVLSILEHSFCCVDVFLLLRRTKKERLGFETNAVLLFITNKGDTLLSRQAESLVYSKELVVPHSLSSPYVKRKKPARKNPGAKKRAKGLSGVIFPRGLFTVTIDRLSEKRQLVV